MLMRKAFEFENEDGSKTVCYEDDGAIAIRDELTDLNGGVYIPASLVMEIIDHIKANFVLPKPEEKKK